MLLIHRTGQKRQEKMFFLEWGPHASVRHTAVSKHDAINPAVATKNSNTHLKDENIENFCETAKIQKSL